MNCQQFENKIHQLLDERSAFSLDPQFRQHADACDACRDSLRVYGSIANWAEHESTSPLTSAMDLGPVFGDSDDSISSELIASAFAEMKPSPNDSPSQIIPGKENDRQWQVRQQRAIRNRILVSVAAMLLVGFFLVNHSNPDESVKVLAPPTLADRELVTVEISPEKFRSFQSFSSGLSDWVSSAIPQSFESMSLHSLTGFDGIDLRGVDMVAFMPQQPVQMVRNLPATFESIESIYRYSNDFPLIRQWSSGLNCTIGLLQSSMPSANKSSEPVEAGDGVGKRISQSDRFTIC